MTELTAAAQFATGCLALGLGLFLVTNAVQGIVRAPLPSAVGVRTLSVLGGALLLAAGAYAARLAVPL
ncbi:MAG TPA: hypothetical protein VJ253_01420 [Dehalococcoidia bacterium]|nr:hypothetical protein [Dehalococcoidia bacterium]